LGISNKALYYKIKERPPRPDISEELSNGYGPHSGTPVALRSTATPSNRTFRSRPLEPSIYLAYSVR
jgi:hypothetical protein